MGRNQYKIEDEWEEEQTRSLSDLFDRLGSAIGAFGANLREPGAACGERKRAWKEIETERQAQSEQEAGGPDAAVK